MVKSTDKVCWYCHDNTMVPFKNYYKCTKCGATWNEIPGIKHDTDINHFTYFPSVGDIPARKSRDASAWVVSEAAKARALVSDTSSIPPQAPPLEERRKEKNRVDKNR